VRAARQSTFFELLEMGELDEVRFVAALEQVDEYARRFRESPIYYNLVKYKEIVRAVLRALIEKSFMVDEHSFHDYRGRRRLFMLVRTVDDKLEELTRLFLRQQLSGLELVARLDEIRGLLLDLYL
jgi:uncharacterized protein YaaR (DUF327 family)